MGIDELHTTRLHAPHISTENSPRKERLSILQISLPSELYSFLLNHVDSVAELECLLLARTESNKSWTAEEMAQRLYINVPNARHVLDSLATRGFMVRNIAADTVNFKYGPNSGEVEQEITRIANLYTEYLIPISQFLHAKRNQVGSKGA